MPSYLVEFPPHRLTDEALIEMSDIGAKYAFNMYNSHSSIVFRIISKWNSMKCSDAASSASHSIRKTDSSSQLLSLLILILLSAFHA